MGGVVPNFVVREVDAFLGCGILAHGFLRLRCAHCAFNHLVAFSCKGRGFCPSCGARRMAERAAHWMDAVLPHVPVRQWVLSLPFALRFKAAFDADICLKIVTFFNRAVRRYVRHAAKCQGRVASVRHLHTGTLTCVQRFSSSLSLNVHLHTLALDGAYEEDAAGRLRFIATPPPTQADIRRVVEQVHARVQALLGADASHDDRHVDDEHRLLFVLGSAAIANRHVTDSGTLCPVERVGPLIRAEDVNLTIAAAAGRRPGAHLGYSLHAQVRVRAHDRRRLEKLARYVLRPPICPQRLCDLGDGRLGYVLKRPWSDGTTMVAFAPLEFLQKLVTLVPPPRRHQVIYSGVLAAHARLRSQIVPRQQAKRVIQRQTDAPVVACHRLRWAELLKRTYGVDAAVCPRCGESLKLIAVITVHEVIRAILLSSGLAAAPPSRQPSRYEAQQQYELDWEPT